tara:strand:+ start:54637 stop:55407 length:771 start_codon:yes stop_codon:yes gene_type:complete
MTAKSTRRLFACLFCVLILNGVKQNDVFAADPPNRTTFARVRVMADAGPQSRPSEKSKQESTSPDATSKRKATERTRTAATPSVDSATEQRVQQMVRAHLPEIDQMLRRLRESSPDAYQRAVRDLAKSVRKLELAKKRDEALFEIEVQLLKARSNVNLLTAKLKLRDTDADRKSLRKAAEQLHRSEIAREEYEVKFLQERIEHNQRQLDTLKKRIAAQNSNAETLLSKNYVGYLRRAGLQPDNAKPKKSAKPRKKP